MLYNDVSVMSSNVKQEVTDWPIDRLTDPVQKRKYLIKIVELSSVYVNRIHSYHYRSLQWGHRDMYYLLLRWKRHPFPMNSSTLVFWYYLCNNTTVNGASDDPINFVTKITYLHQKSYRFLLRTHNTLIWIRFRSEESHVCELLCFTTYWTMSIYVCWAELGNLIAYTVCFA